MPDLFERSPNSSRFVIRPAQLQDATALAEILAASFHAREGWMGWLYPLFRLGIYEDLRGRLRTHSPNYICLVAIDPTRQVGVSEGGGDWIVGTLEMSLRSYPWSFTGTQHLYISNLAVHTAGRRQGVAQQLLNACEKIALQRGFQCLYLHVLETNQHARRLYSKAGYRLLEADPAWRTWLLNQPRRLFLRKCLTSTLALWAT